MIVRQLCFNRRQECFVTAHVRHTCPKLVKISSQVFPPIRRQRLSNVFLYDNQPGNCHEARQANIWRVIPGITYSIAYSGSLTSKESKGMGEGLQPASRLPVVRPKSSSPCLMLPYAVADMNLIRAAGLLVGSYNSLDLLCSIDRQRSQ